MEDASLMKLLTAYDKKIMESSAISLEAIRGLQTLKSTSLLRELYWKRIIEFVLTSVIILFLGRFLYATIDHSSMAISAGILMVFYLVGLSGCIRQVILISKFNYNHTVIENQAILASLQSYIIFYLRLSVLQFPFYLTYVIIGSKLFFDLDIWLSGNANWIISQLVLSVLLVPFSWWLYNKLSYKNTEISWVNKLINLSGGQQVADAIRFLNDIDHFKQEQ